MRYIIILFFFSILTHGQNGVNTPLKAFPDAFGGGANSTGGRGKSLAIVNTLNRNTTLTFVAATGGNAEYYTGGLFPAMQNTNVGYIVFNISGNIALGTGGTAAQFGGGGMQDVNNKTIFGQSAPLGGITLNGGGFRLDGRFGDNQHLIIRYIRSRPINDKDGNQMNTSGTIDDDANTWALLISGGNNIMVDHFSGAFAFDKVMGGAISELHVDQNSTFYGVTYQNSMLSDGHTLGYSAVNPDRRDDPEQFMSDHSWIKNLFLGGNRTPNMAFDGYGEVVNNVIYEIPSKNITTYMDIDLNHIGNYYKDATTEPNRIFDYDTGTVSIFTRNNFATSLLSGNETGNNTGIWNFNDGTLGQASSSFFTSTRHSGTRGVAYTEISASDAYQDVVINGNVGAYKYLDNNGNVQIYRDPYDTQMLDVAKNGTSYSFRQVSNFVLPTIPSNTRPSDYDTDNDGMSDAWEIREYGNLNQSYGGDFDGDGYENIEEFFNQVDRTAPIAAPGGTVISNPRASNSGLINN